MIKLIDLLKEMYIDKQGNLVGEADFVVLEGGMRGGIYKNKNQINVSDYINFTTKLYQFRKKDIANKIYKQILLVYNQSALKKYNDLSNFTPSIYYSAGGNWDVPSYTIEMSNGLKIEGAVEPSYYYPETGWDDFIKQMRQTLNVDDLDFKDAEKIKNQSKDIERFQDLDVEDLKDKIEYTPLICIPKFQFRGNIIEQLDADLINKSEMMDDKHTLYSKSNLLDDLNEIGLFLISENKKPNDVDLSKTEYTLYIIKPDAIDTGHYADGSGSYETHYNTPFIIFCKDNENWKDVLKRFHKSSFENVFDGYLRPATYIFGGEAPSRTKAGVKMDTMVPGVPKVTKYKNITIPKEIFNELRKNVVFEPDPYNKKYQETFPEFKK